MATYRVSGEVAASCWTLVEAESEEEAIARAREFDRHVTTDPPSNFEDDAPHFFVGEVDGTAMGLRAELESED